MLISRLLIKTVELQLQLGILCFPFIDIHDRKSVARFPLTKKPLLSKFGAKIRGFGAKVLVKITNRAELGAFFHDLAILTLLFLIFFKENFMLRKTRRHNRAIRM